MTPDDLLSRQGTAGPGFGRVVSVFLTSAFIAVIFGYVVDWAEGPKWAIATVVMLTWLIACGMGFLSDVVRQEVRRDA